MSDLTEAVQHLAVDLGWPVMPIKPKGKEPLTPHGVKDATTDERTLLHYWERWPDANIGVACGTPGPTVLDIDSFEQARFIHNMLTAEAHPPEAATARGRHLYFAGSERGTIAVGYGEVRGKGSYVVCPPSVHPSGKTYTWLVEPNRRLPPLPESVLGERKPAGTGAMAARERVPHGERHDHLKDFATRLLRAGVTDEPTIERMLRAEYEAVCDPDPPARPDEFTKLARWATQTKIAERERTRGTAGEPPSSAPAPPSADAPLSEHKAFVNAAAGWTPHFDVADVRRFGQRDGDALHIYLTGGGVVDFARQKDITTRGAWPRMVVAATNGIADPRGMRDHELVALYRSLCVLAAAPAFLYEADDHREIVADLLALCELVVGHHAQSSAAIFELIEASRGRAQWDPFDRASKARPALIVDERTDERHLRGGELIDYFRFRGAGIHTRDFPGRMLMLGLTRMRLNGREAPNQKAAARRQNTAVFYRIDDFEPGVPKDA